MGRQWLHAKRAIASQKKAQATGKIVKEIIVAAKMGGADPNLNARLAATLEKARKESVSREVIERAIRKGSGADGENVTMEHLVIEGYAPHKVPVIVELLTDNPNRTNPEMRVLFRQGHMGGPGSNKFLFDFVGLVEAYHSDTATDLETAAIEAGANEVESLTSEQNDDIPSGVAGARFITDRTAIHAVSRWLTQNGWIVITSEMGYLPKQYPALTEAQQADVGEFLQALDDHDDVHRVWAALR
ncbi:MAG TPA: YebC/PmpR family DNA-binding transcriptional regulator [Candidatus Paceibacterota bacterium]|nr:YebC/PmpR family DNA-binding transcriptional regulator [Verrucomicrobiota bacterium]HRY47887.1 YebC/PmpR family DNA-binding transcriptional regulator [Candidatus Paceibacterota bacterium]HSA00369.1 YebC/PmpR family DNA-binding transcriptional regulator [Candidatus Paceibacterota bacterium]